MKQSAYPSLYQLNTRVYLTDLSHKLGRKATLDDIPESELDRLADMGFEWIWFLSVWCTGKLAQNISRQQADWRQDYEATLSDLKEEDIAGSGFAIADYKVHPDLGGDAALKRLRIKLNERGLKLMLDFVPNHMGPDHKWVEELPEFFIQGTEYDLETSPQNYFCKENKQGDIIFAYGRDPYFSGWPDTVQLDFSNQETVAAMAEELKRISGQCDGVRCDMAMLILPEIFEKTWGRRALSFWSELIHSIHKINPDFVFMAEVYWDMEWPLQQIGFNYTYDKRLYDRLLEGNGRSVKEHLWAELDYQQKMVRFLENHDETRAASAFDPYKHKAAAIITYLSPGLRFFHQGQFEGRLKRISPHLDRAPIEVINQDLQNFYSKLLSLLKQAIFKTGEWKLLECSPTREGNHSWESFLAFHWSGQKGKQILVVVNYAPNEGQCDIQLPSLEKENYKLLMIDPNHHHNVYEISDNGLLFKLPAWGFEVLRVEG